jgi:predicted RNase H-like HicB family nuclease
MYRFLVVIEKANNNSSAYSPDLLGCVATGATREEAENNMYEANGIIKSYLL